MDDNIYILIPSRIGSTRLKNKPLVDLNGKTLIQRVYQNASHVSENTFIATDSILIKENLSSITSNVLMTSSKHISGTDRIFEAAELLNLSDNNLIINLQGDEPFLPKELIHNIVNDYNTNSCDVITASTEITSSEELDNLNTVLVETDNKNLATKFQRTSTGMNDPKKHIGIYGYSMRTLRKIINLEPTSNELEFKLEQLRFLENDYSIYVTHISTKIHSGIDTHDDVIAAVNFLKTL